MFITETSLVKLDIVILLNSFIYHLPFWRVSLILSCLLSTLSSKCFPLALSILSIVHSSRLPGFPLNPTLRFDLWRHCMLSTSVRSSSLQPVDYSLPNSSVHGILPARIPAWVAIPSSRGSSWPRDWTCLLHLLLWQVGSLPLVSPGKPLEGIN